MMLKPILLIVVFLCFFTGCSNDDNILSSDHNRDNIDKSSEIILKTSEGNVIEPFLIRGRGNSTWRRSDKKPYNIKLDKKSSILGMNKSKHWLLLANAYFDRTQLHNATAFEIARQTDYEWIPSGQYVELMLNGEYRGLYYLCEKIGAEKGKIEINETTGETPVEEAGYLLESLTDWDNGQDFINRIYPFGTFYTGIITKCGYRNGGFCQMMWEIKEPEKYLTQAHIDYIKSRLQKMEYLLKEAPESGEYRDYFDIEAAADYYLIQDLCLNEEVTRSKNIFLYVSGSGGSSRLDHHGILTQDHLDS